jgi:hypothetical protein
MFHEVINISSDTLIRIKKQEKFSPAFLIIIKIMNLCFDMYQRSSL